MPTPREKLIEKLKVKHYGYAFRGYFYYEEIADLILEDRKRICAPLVKLHREGYLGGKESEKGTYQKSIEEALKLAGLDKE